MIHRIRTEAWRRVTVAIAALYDARRNMRRRNDTGGDQTIVAIRTIRIGYLVDISAARPVREIRRRASVAGYAITSSGHHVARIRRYALSAFGSLLDVRSAVAGVTAARAYRRMVHRISGEARRCIGVAVAALDAGHWNMRRRGVAGRSGPVVAARATGVARLMHVDGAGPTRKCGGRAGVAGGAVATARRDVAGIGRRALRPACPLPCERPVVAGVAAGRAHRRMVHRIGDKARCRIRVAVAALDASDRDMRWRRIASRYGPVVAARAVGVACLMDVRGTSPACIGSAGAGVAGDAVTTARRHVAGVRRGGLRPLRALACERAVVTSIAAAGTHRRMVHRIGGKARCRIVMAVAALNAGDRDVRRRGIACSRRAVVAAGAIRVVREVDIFCSGPTGEAARCAGVAANTVASPVAT